MNNKKRREVLAYLAEYPGAELADVVRACGPTTRSCVRVAVEGGVLRLVPSTRRVHAWTVHVVTE